jgi:hypothetical protein
MEPYTFAAPSAARRWRTAALDTMGLFAIIWSIPLVIVIVGAPVALALFTIRQIISWAVAQ